jgi:hypothetical protein
MNNVTKRIDPICESQTDVGCLPVINNVSGGCSPIFSVSEVGDYCRNLYSQMSDGDRDTVMQNYCDRYINAEECKCARRSSNPDYKKLKLDNPYSDACWYIPCANRYQFFVPSSFNKVSKCPENICQIVFNTSQTHDVNMDHIKNDINCDFSNGGVIPTPDGIPNVIYYGMVAVFVAFIMIYAIK